MAKIPGLDDLKGQSKALKDIGNKLDKITQSASSYNEKMKDSAHAVDDLANKIDRAFERMAQGPVTQKGIDKIDDMIDGLERLKKSTAKASISVEGVLLKSIDKLGKGMMSVGFDIFEKGLHGLIDGIQRVYDLQERWTKAIGELNKRMGVLSPSMGAFRKEASKAESSIRGLGGELGEGTKMAGELASAFGKMTGGDIGDLGVTLARGFDMGTESSGKFLRVLSNLGFDEQKKEASGFMSAIVDGAQAAGVPVNDLAKDLSESRNFMTQFGKEGAKSFVKSTAYLRSFGINLKHVEGMMSKFDTFDAAADNVSKLNMTFKTNINAMQMMLEQDPAKRFEMIRRGMLKNGETFNTLSRAKIMLLKETTGLDESELSAMLDKKNEDVKYSDFLKKKQLTEKTEAEAQKRMTKQLQATATTLFNFGAAFDKITVSIMKVIRPFTDMLGLSKKGGKDFHSFGEVMGGITDRIVAFFDALAKNKQWQTFMEKAAAGVKSLASKVGEFLSPENIPKLINKVVDAFDKLKYAAMGVMALFIGGKMYAGFKLISSFAKQLSTIKGLSGKIEGYGNQLAGMNPNMGGSGKSNSYGDMSEGARSDILSKSDLAAMNKRTLRQKLNMSVKPGGFSAGGAIAGAGIGEGAGMGVSSLIEALGGVKSSKAGKAGAAGLGALGGAFLGPIGAALGGVIGQTFGDIGSDLNDRIFTPKLTKAQQAYADGVERLSELDAAAEKEHSIRQERYDREGMRTDIQDRRRARGTKQLIDIDGKLHKAGKKNVELSWDESQSIMDRASDLLKFGKVTGDARAQLEDLASGAKPTTAELDTLVTKSNLFSKAIDIARGKIENELVDVLDKVAGKYDEQIDSVNDQIDKAKELASQYRDQATHFAAGGLKRKAMEQIAMDQDQIAESLEKQKTIILKNEENEKSKVETKARIAKRLVATGGQEQTATGVAGSSGTATGANAQAGGAASGDKTTTTIVQLNIDGKKFADATHKHVTHAQAKYAARGTRD